MVATLKDIAQKVNITEQAVSQALRGYPNISPGTIKHVREVAKQLGYRPNLMARNLRRQQTKAIGFVLPDITYDYSQKIIEGAKSVLEPKGYLTMIGLTSWDPKQEAREIDLLLGYQVEALLCQPIVESTRTYQRLAELGVSFVFVGNALDIPGTGWVGLDDYDSSQKITTHLIEQGHTRIGVITPDTTPASLSLMPRIHAYRDVLQNHGIPVREEFIGYSKVGKAESVPGVVDQLMGLEDPPTAIFAISDVIAYSVMSHLQKKGLRVPYDVAVAGIGNMAPSAFEMISLTTVSMDTYRIGQRAAQQLLDRLLKKEALPIQEPVKGELIVRRSTGRRS
jgi:DNA-binding LacI/PurR family transcriptional regulator